MEEELIKSSQPIERDENDVLGASPTEEKLTTAAPVEVASKPETGMSDFNESLSDKFSATRDVEAQHARERGFSDSEAEYLSAVKSKEEATQKAAEQEQAVNESKAEVVGIDNEILALQEKINFIEEQGGSSAASREELNALLIKKESLSPPKVEQEQKSITNIIEDGTSDKQQSMDRIVASNAAEVEQQKEINSEQQRLDTMDRFRNKEMEAVQKENAKSKATIKAERAKLDSEDLQIKEESKETFWGSLSIPEKILAGISLFIGGAGGRNHAAETFNNHVKAFAEEKGKANKNVALARKQAYERINLELDLMTKRTNNVVKIEKIKMLQESNRIEIAKAQKEREDAARGANTLKEILANKLKLEDLTPEQIDAAIPFEKRKEAKGIRAEYQKETEKLGTRGVINSYRDVVSMAAEGSTGKTDIALLTKFMKTLDPGSVVREGEFHIAADASPALRAVVTRMKGLVTGEKLAPADRKEFAAAVTKLLKPKLRTQKEINHRYKSVIRQHGLPHSLVVEDFSLEKVSKKAAIIEMQKKRFPNKSQAQIEKAVDKLFPNID